MLGNRRGRTLDFGVGVKDISKANRPAIGQVDVDILVIGHAVGSPGEDIVDRSYAEQTSLVELDLKVEEPHIGLGTIPVVLDFQSLSRNVLQPGHILSQLVTHSLVELFLPAGIQSSRELRNLGRDGQP